MTTELTFPENFYWGSATAAHQIEGGNTNSDWWRFEHQTNTPCAEPSGDACDSWHRYDEDVELVASLGMNAYRFSLEWARIEPAPGEFSRAALAHYREQILACRRLGLTPVVTLHHFTLPQWVSDDGGFESENIVGWLTRYASEVSRALGDVIGVACTINEPNIVALMGYFLASFPPAVSDLTRFANVNATMRYAHAAMRDVLQQGPGDFPIGIALSMQEWEALPGGEESVELIRSEMEDKYLEFLRSDDFVGVQAYTKIQIGAEGMIVPENALDMGYLYWPQCVEYTVRRAAQLSGAPLIVTENGIGTTDDALRIRYLSEALAGLHRVINEGVDVRGYFQWSLLDNFEWTHGYAPQFGIVAVDRTTFERTPKESARWYGQVARTGNLTLA